MEPALKPITKICCAYCGEEYETAKQAAACPKLFSDHFVVGDVVRYAGRVWRIRDVSSSSCPYVSLGRVTEYLEAFGYKHIRNYQPEKASVAARFFCGKTFEKFAVDQAYGQLTSRRKQVTAAEKFVEMVDATYRGASGGTVFSENAKRSRKKQPQGSIRAL